MGVPCRLTRKVQTSSSVTRHETSVKYSLFNLNVENGGSLDHVERNGDAEEDEEEDQIGHEASDANQQRGLTHFPT